MSIKQSFVGATSAQQNFVDDLFSCTLYNGNGSTQSINNGIDLSTYGGMVWTKCRSQTYNAEIHDTVRGANNRLIPSSTGAQTTGTDHLNSFNSNGFTLGQNENSNAFTDPAVSWTFRKAAKFFDVVTYTGNGTAGRTISHNLGTTPGMIIVKKTSAASTIGWFVYHRSLGASEVLKLNLTNAQDTYTAAWNNTSPTSTQFTVGSDTDVNANGASFVAYLFAHDTGTDGIIQCGSFTTDGSGNATVNLGWEPQYLMMKVSSTTGHWYTLDNMRGWAQDTTGLQKKHLSANLSNAEAASALVCDVSPTGFSMHDGGGLGVSNTVIYLAIRRSNKPPTSGTQVFMPTVYTGTNAANRFLSTTIAPDFVMIRQRNDTVLTGMVTGSRLTGQGYLLTGGTAAEVTNATALDQQLVSATEYGTFTSSNSGIYIGNNATAKLNANTTSNNHIALAFKRAVGVFDEVCYSGSGSNLTVNHSLGVVPELIIIKNRGSAAAWPVFYGMTSTQMGYVKLNQSTGGTTDTYANIGVYLTGQPTATSFTVYPTSSEVSNSGQNFVARLFATKAGISKVGSYTGNGTSQTINCGFTTGARFVLIKNTTTAEDWAIYDSARGIIAGNDPFLTTNATYSEGAVSDKIDPDNSGFIVNATSGNSPDMNINGNTYIFLALA